MQPTEYIRASTTDPSSQDEFSKLFRLLLRNSGLEEDDVGELDVEDDPLKTEIDVDKEYQPLEEHEDEITHSTNEEAENDLHGFRITDISQILRCHHNSGKKVSVPVDQASHSKRNGQLVFLRPVIYQPSSDKETSLEEYLLPHPFTEGESNCVDLKSDYGSDEKNKAAKTEIFRVQRRARNSLLSSSVVIPALAEKQILTPEEHFRNSFEELETNRVGHHKDFTTGDDSATRAASSVNVKQSCEKLGPRPSVSIHLFRKLLNLQPDESSSRHLLAAPDSKSLRFKELTKKDNITSYSSTFSPNQESLRKNILEDERVHQVPHTTTSCLVSRNDSSVCNPSNKLRVIKAQNWMKSAYENDQLRTKRMQNWMKLACEKEPVLKVTSSENSSRKAYSFQNFRKDAIEDFKKRMQTNLERTRTADQSNNVNVFIIRDPPKQQTVEICRRPNTKSNELNQNSKEQLFGNSYADGDTDTRITNVFSCNTNSHSAVEDEDVRKPVSVSHGEKSFPEAKDEHFIEDYETVYVYPDPSPTEEQRVESHCQVPSETDLETSHTSDSERHAGNHCEVPETDSEISRPSNPGQYADKHCEILSATDVEIRTFDTEQPVDNHCEALSETDVELSTTADSEVFMSHGKSFIENPDWCEKLDDEENLDLYEIQMQLLVDSPPAANEDTAVSTVPEYYVERAARLFERKQSIERRKNLDVLAVSKDVLTSNNLAKLCNDIQAPQLSDIFIAEEEGNPSKRDDHSYAVVSRVKKNEKNTCNDLSKTTDSESELPIETLFMCPSMCTSRIFKTVKGLKRHLSSHRNHQDGAQSTKRVPRFRTRIVGAERSQLRYFFDHTPYPSSSAKRELAAKLNLDYSKVHAWFQNRRASLKRKSRLEEAVTSHSHAENRQRHKCDSSADADETLFLCASCQTSFLTEEELNRHLATHSHKKKMERRSSDVAYVCATCKRSFSQKRDLVKHVSVHMEMHTGTNDGDGDTKSNVQLASEDCDQAYSSTITAEDSSSYLNPSIGSGTLPSDETSSYLANDSKPFVDDETLSSHPSVEPENLQPNQTERPEVCLFCAELFAGKEAHREHFVNAHSICCNQATPNVDVVRRHLAKHSNAGPYWCDTCGESYISKKSLKAHILSHGTNRTFSCDYCKRRCSSEVSLERHMTSHSKSFVCAHCNKVFLRKCKLREHILSAMSTVPLVCPEADCCQSFTNNCSLTRHVLFHGGDKSHKCATRLSSPSEPASFLHARSKRMPIKKIRHGKMYFRRDVLKRHLLIHDSDSWLSCSHCGLSFPQKDKLRNHIMKTHGLVAECDRLCQD